MNTRAKKLWKRRRVRESARRRNLIGSSGTAADPDSTRSLLGLHAKEDVKSWLSAQLDRNHDYWDRPTSRLPSKGGPLRTITARNSRKTVTKAEPKQRQGGWYTAPPLAHEKLKRGRGIFS